MNISFELYRVFYIVASEGNITKASKRLLISQPAISKSIKRLEEQLGGQLFVRTKRGVVLTEEGEIFYQYIKQAIESISNAENKFNDLINLETGIIRIGVSTTLTKEFLMPYLEEFHRLYPKMEIQIDTSVSSKAFSKLREGLLDLMILNLPTQDQPDMIIQEVKKIRSCFIVNKNFSYLVGRKLQLKELNQYPLLMQAKGSNTRKFIDDFYDENNIILNPSMTLSSYSLVVEFSKIGFGIGLANEDFIKDELKNKKLFKLDVIPKLPERGIGLAYSKKNIPNFGAKRLIQMISEGKY